MGQHKRTNKLLFTAKGLHLSLVAQRPITQDVQLASGASQEYFFGLGASHLSNKHGSGGVYVRHYKSFV